MKNWMKALKNLRLVVLLCSFLAVGTLGSCREQPKQENSDQQSEVQEEHPEAEEHPEGEEHPAGEEHPEGEEHPAGEEHPTDSL